MPDDIEDDEDDVEEEPSDLEEEPSDLEDDDADDDEPARMKKVAPSQRREADEVLVGLDVDDLDDEGRVKVEDIEDAKLLWRKGYADYPSGPTFKRTGRVKLKERALERRKELDPGTAKAAVKVAITAAMKKQLSPPELALARARFDAAGVADVADPAAVKLLVRAGYVHHQLESQRKGGWVHLTARGKARRKELERGRLTATVDTRPRGPYAPRPRLGT